MKDKKCRICKKPFKPFTSTTQVVCSPFCAVVLAKDKQKKKFKKETAKRKKEFRANDIKFQKNKAQTAFNAYIRERDKHLPCISCGKHHKGQYHAGHYKTRGAYPELAFSEDNCHKQCAPCNNHKSGDIANYRTNLILKIGEERVLALEGHHEPVKRTADDYAKLAMKYRLKLSILID